MNEGLRANALRGFRLILESAAGGPLPQLDEILDRVQLVGFGPGAAIIDAGEPHPFLYWVVQGVVRVETKVNDRTVTMGLRQEGEWVTDLSGLGMRAVRRVIERDLYPKSRLLEAAGRGVALHSFRAIEPTLLLQADAEHLDELIESHVEWARLFSTFVVMHSLTSQTDFTIARSGSPAEAYRALVDDRPDLVRRVTQREIARLLGVSEAGLSRVIKRVHAESAPTETSGAQ